MKKEEESKIIRKFLEDRGHFISAPVVDPFHKPINTPGYSNKCSGCPNQDRVMIALGLSESVCRTRGCSR